MSEKDHSTIAPSEQFTNVSDIYDETYINEHARIVPNNDWRTGEAAELYGNFDDIENYGYVTRGSVIQIEGREGLEPTC